MQAKAQIDTMMQQLDPTWNPHQMLEFFKLCNYLITNWTNYKLNRNHVDFMNLCHLTN